MICLYEDKHQDNFSPLIDLRALFELRFGCSTFLKKLRALYPREPFCLWVRDEICELIQEKYPDCLVNQKVEPPALFISASAVLFEQLPVKGEEEAFVAENRLVGFRLNRAFPYRAGFPIKQLPRKQKDVRAKVYLYPYEMIADNPEELKREIKGFIGMLAMTAPKGRMKKAGGDELVLSRGAKIHKGAFISTENGPVYLDENSEVRPLSFVQGPCYIGKGTIIDSCLVGPGCSFGPECRIGGEVECSIFQGYANKHHAGFIGHSFIGEWVNLGALTTCSDLKNNYGPVKVLLKNKEINTGILKLGCFIGDHTKTAIGTLIPTGAVIGTFVNWFEGGLMPKYLPAFAWGKNKRWQKNEIVETARRVMVRRNTSPSPTYEKLLLRLYHWTGKDGS